jgi:hypothetical protein
VNCAKVRELASEYVEGTLPDALRQAVRAHADTCSACREDLAALRTLWKRLDAVPEVEPPPFLHENVMAAVAQEAWGRPAAWRALLPRLSRVALGTLAAGGALAAGAALLFLPATNPDKIREASPVLGPVGSIMPGTAYQERPAAPPRLQIARTTMVDREHGPAYRFSLWLEEASHGTARLHLLEDASLTRQGTPYHFILDSEQARSLVVPFAAVPGDTMSLYVSWTANGERHTKCLFVPLPQDGAAPEVKQSFGLPPSSLLVAAREVAVRYRRPVTLEDVPPLERVTVTARQETATEALGRALAGRGVRVALSGAGILIEPDRTAPAVLPGG